jgi:enhancer of mRNA-decapping protein 3
MVVFFPASGHRLNSYHVEGHAIADIKVNVAPAPAQSVPQPPSAPPYQQYPSSHVQQHVPNPGLPVPHHAPQQSIQHMNQPMRQPVQPPASQSAPFVDPAILSMGKRTSTAPSSNQLAVAPPQEAPATPIKPNTTARTATLPKNVPSFISQAKGHNTRKPSAATLEGPFSSLDIADAEEADSETKKVTSVRRASINKTRNGKPMEDVSPQKLDDGGKKTRRGGKSRKKELAAQERKNGGDLQSGPDAARKGYVLRLSSSQGLCETNVCEHELTSCSKGNGWRNTPILQDAEQPLTRTPGVIGGRVGLVAAHASKTKTRRQKALDATNGWATEDATDIHDMPEFDFQSNLSKFDKRTVFDQIRNEDTTADEDRLVSFNRIARPGTHGGKNLHPTENVLDRKLKSTTNTSSEDDSEFGSSRNSRRAMSRASVKRAPVRQGSGVQADMDYYRVLTARSSVGHMLLPTLLAVLDQGASQHLQIHHLTAPPEAAYG